MSLDVSAPRKIAIYVTPTGGGATKKDTPHIPLQPEEIAEVIAECHELGAAIGHIHVRDQDGWDTCDGALYRKVNALVRSRCDIVINDSAGGGTTGNMVEEVSPGNFKVIFAERMKTFDADPEVIVVDPFTKTYARSGGGTTLFETTPAQAEEMVRQSIARGLIPELSVNSLEQYHERVVPLLDLGIIPKPYHLSISAGKSIGIDTYDPAIMAGLVAELRRPDVYLRVGAGGPNQWAALAHGIILGADCIRVGIEDATHDRNGNPVSNQDMVRRAVRMITDLGFAVATPAEARQMMGLPAVA